MNIDKDALQRKLFLDSPSIETKVGNLVQERFLAAQRQLVNDFDDHPVTVEIKAGNSSDNISGTLSGRGNLFTFIGFPENTHPTNIVRDFLLHQIKLVKIRKYQQAQTSLFDYKLLIPIDELYSSTPMPFEIGNSWVEGIERGISGFSHFIYLKLNNKNSRSGRGLETESTISGGEFVPTLYLTPMLQKFIEACKLP